MRSGQKRVSAPWLVMKIFARWDDLLALTPQHRGTPYLDGIWAYAIGSAHIAKGNMDAAEKTLATLQKIANAPNADEYRVGATPASAVLKLAALGLEGEAFRPWAIYQEPLQRLAQALLSKIKTTTPNHPTGPNPCATISARLYCKLVKRRKPKRFIAVICAGIKITAGLSTVCIKRCSRKTKPQRPI